MRRLAGDVAAFAQLPRTPETQFDARHWGTVGSYYLRREPDWIHRHVETIDVQGATFGRRRLTIDFSLPEDDAAIVSRGRDCNLYCIPIAYLAKREPRAKIDFCDESGARLPLLTRHESEVLSFFAFNAAVRAELGGEPPHGAIDQALLHLLAQPERAAEFQYHLFGSAGAALEALAASPGFPHIRAQAEALIDDLIVWQPVTGSPGERRSFRLSHQIEFGPRNLVAQRTVTKEEEIAAGEGPAEIPVDRPGGIDWFGTGGRAVARLGVRLGISAQEIELREPALRGALSYHLQIQAPPDLRVVTPRLAVHAELEPRPRRTLHVQSAGTSQYAHLYISGHRVVAQGSVLAALRPSRVGLISQSALACILIATMLWFFAQHWAKVSTEGNAETSAAILLIAPAVLTAFVYRGPEHRLAARMLAGVRGLVILAGAMSVASAASLVGAVRFGLQGEDGAKVFASVATAAALWLALVWTRWLPWGSLGHHRRRWWTEAEISWLQWIGCLVIACIWTLVSSQLVLGVGFGPELQFLLWMLLVPWALLWVAGLGALHLKGKLHTIDRLMLALTAIVLFATGFSGSAARAEALERLAFVLLGVVVIRAAATAVWTLVRSP